MTTTSIPLTATSPCPCGSSQNYSDCCQPYHQGERPATAEKLMRSRFCAYSLKNTDYLLATTWPRQLEALDKAGIHKQTDETQWRRLEIIGIEAGMETDTKGKVEFNAWFLNPANNSEEPYHENSDFIKEEGQWFFIYPDMPAKLPNRNDPCLCGSGKKFKKCCMPTF